MKFLLPTSVLVMNGQNALLLVQLLALKMDEC